MPAIVSGAFPFEERGEDVLAGMVIFFGAVRARLFSHHFHGILRRAASPAGLHGETVEKAAMTRLIRWLSTDSVAG